MTSVNSNNNNSGLNGNHHKKHNKNTGWIVGGSIAGAVAVTGGAYCIYRQMNPPEPPSVMDTFVKKVLPMAKDFAKPALGIGALFGVGMLIKKAVSHDLEAGEESLLSRAYDSVRGLFGGGNHEMEIHPDDYHY